ncbi:hypothetical protein ET475_08790 [Microbacterium protaetiae]|uniref:Flagellar assembly protein FliH/Type III secretion system HrpE domain-containing protein n=1 Tax=Microbacterium protaetiae TaxID=2509458 RepID=A0A4P6ECW2_9MICO|nr:FliH/SctL family protein [Microbacterium protaetiae]QAY60075.1 hypothetical protein ET475_08790 [Microbacterium protaetiae]
MSADIFAPVVFPHLHDAGLEAERERAWHRGYADGHAAGVRAAVEQAAVAAAGSEARRAARDEGQRRLVARAITTLHAAAEALHERTQQVSAATTDQVFARAIELATVIIAAELSDVEGSASAAVRRALRSADPADVCEIRLNPDDLAALERLEVAPVGISLVADEQLARGDAIAVVDDGYVDARVDAALKRARRAVQEVTA